MQEWREEFIEKIDKEIGNLNGIFEGEYGKVDTDMGLFLAVLRKFSVYDVFQYGTPEMRDNFKAAKIAIECNPKMYEYLSDRLKSDVNLSIIAISGWKDAFKLFPDDHYYNKEVIRFCMPDIYPYLSEDYMGDKELANIALRHGEEHLEYASPDIILTYFLKGNIDTIQTSFSSDELLQIFNSTAKEFVKETAMSHKDFLFDFPTLEKTRNGPFKKMKEVVLDNYTMYHQQAEQLELARLSNFKWNHNSKERI